MIARLWALLYVLCLQEYFTKAEDCHSPVSHGFSGCGKNTGSYSAPFGSAPVRSLSECVRYCIASAECKSVTVPMSDHSTNLLCELYKDDFNCGNTEYREGFQYYRQIAGFRVCITPAPSVRSAARISNNTYTLFFDSMLQNYMLDEYGSLYAINCPVNYNTYVRSWPSEPVKAVARSDALGTGERYFVVHGNLVDQFFFTPSMAFPTFSAPWPQTTEGFFGAGVPENIKALCAKGNEFYVYTDDGIYTSTVFNNGSQIITNKEPPHFSTEFDWMSLTSAALTDDPEVSLLFQSNTYFLYNTAKQVVAGRGTVCTNSY